MSPPVMSNEYFEKIFHAKGETCDRTGTFYRQVT
jgi:hypothetical protein